MKIGLPNFELPGTPGVQGDVTYTAIEFDRNSFYDPENEDSAAYLVTGYIKDGSDGCAGVLIHGTKNGGTGRYMWRVPRVFSAPNEDGMTVVRTEFHNVESLPVPMCRLVGGVKTAEKPGIYTGFMYEGMLDGSGLWYPIEIPGVEETIVKASRGEVLVCSDVGESDAVHVYSLVSQQWSRYRIGSTLAWKSTEVEEADGGYAIEIVLVNNKPHKFFHPAADD